MKYRIQQLKMHLDHDDKAIEKAICAILGTRTDEIVS